MHARTLPLGTAGFRKQWHLSFEALGHLSRAIDNALRNLGQERDVESEGSLCAALDQPVHEGNAVVALFHVSHVVVVDLPSQGSSRQRQGKGKLSGFSGGEFQVRR